MVMLIVIGDGGDGGDGGVVVPKLLFKFQVTRRAGDHGDGSDCGGDGGGVGHGDGDCGDDCKIVQHT